VVGAGRHRGPADQLDPKWRVLEQRLNLPLPGEDRPEPERVTNQFIGWCV
jgi:hypothetical protein